MVFGIENNKRIICSMCKKVVIRLLPLYDKDRFHKGIMCCIDCKKHMRNGNPEPIVQFKREPKVYEELENKFDQAAGKRKVVERV